MNLNILIRLHSEISAFISEEHKAALKFSIMDQLNLSEGEDLQPEILQKMKTMPVPDELLNFIGTLKQHFKLTSS